MFDFQASFWGLEYLVVSWNCPVLFFLPATTFLFLESGKLPVFPQQAGRTSSLVLNNIRNWAGGEAEQSNVLLQSCAWTVLISLVYS